MQTFMPELERLPVSHPDLSPNVELLVMLIRHNLILCISNDYIRTAIRNILIIVVKVVVVTVTDKNSLNNHVD